MEDQKQTILKLGLLDGTMLVVGSMIGSGYLL
jgi:hypothetical protein